MTQPLTPSPATPGSVPGGRSAPSRSTDLYGRRALEREALYRSRRARGIPHCAGRMAVAHTPSAMRPADRTTRLTWPDLYVCPVCGEVWSPAASEDDPRQPLRLASALDDSPADGCSSPWHCPCGCGAHMGCFNYEDDDLAALDEKFQPLSVSPVRSWPGATSLPAVPEACRVDVDRILGFGAVVPSPQVPLGEVWFTFPADPHPVIVLRGIIDDPPTDLTGQGERPIPASDNPNPSSGLDDSAEGVRSSRHDEHHHQRGLRLGSDDGRRHDP